MAKEVAARKHLAARSWKLVRYADVNISGSFRTAVMSVEKLYSFDCDLFTVVNGQPGCRFIFCVAEVGIFQYPVIREVCPPVNAFGCFISDPSG